MQEIRSVEKAIDDSGLPPALPPRVWVEHVRPSVDGGRFPIKRIVGESVHVEADVFADGHDRVTAALLWRQAGSAAWSETPMTARGNDAWHGTFRVESPGDHEYTVAAWIDRFSSWREELEKKCAAGQPDLGSELLEGASWIRTTASRASEHEAAWLSNVAASLEDETTPQETRTALALAPDVSAVMARHPDRSREAVAEVRKVDVARPRAGSGAWYEMFPRSEGRTLRAAEGALARIAAMGFDVLYLPPIHPIGVTHRKGRNNGLRAGPGDPGSPWAVGSEAGGHEAVHPDLGTLDDFDHFVEAARTLGLEVALDVAFQCSPDHPWVTEHPAWFRHRPDGTVQYAENPPKRYEDIVPFDFESGDWRGLWRALLGVFLFWAGRGVRIFRVDNPHTKPLSFWAWAIAAVKRSYPDAIFLAEAFTRPKVMEALAKLGFDQSYTYFTWRNTKAEITEYLTHLTRDTADFFRPNLFANTPDILPAYLQVGGRPAFLVRLVLASTLGASYGIYSGFELCEAAAVQGTEEYMDSERYEIRHRDWDDPRSLEDTIAALNEIRRRNPALTQQRRLTFHATDHDQILCYSRSTEDLSNVVLVVVNLDPHHRQSGWVDLDLAALGLADGSPFQVHDLLGGGRYLFSGRRNFVELDPEQAPAQVFRVRRHLRTEHDFDYFF